MAKGILQIWLILLLLLLFSCSVMPSSLQTLGLQHSWLHSPSSSPGSCSNSCPLSQWCHPAISSSVIAFSCRQCFPASGPFLMSHLFASGSQSVGVSASVSVFPVNIQDWFPLGMTSFISLQSKRLSRVLHSAFLMVQLSSVHDYWKNHSFD